MEMQKNSTIFCRKVLNLLSFSVCSEFLFEWVVLFFFFPENNVCVCMPQNNFLLSDVKADFVANH